MNRKSLFLVCFTIGIFAIFLVFLPNDMAAHLNGVGNSTKFSNKYFVFLLFTFVDIVGSFFWNNMIEVRLNLPWLVHLDVKEIVKSYFSFLMMLLLFCLLLVTFSNLSSIWLLIGGHFLYLIYLIVISVRYQLK
jgi:hypothetical protein